MKSKQETKVGIYARLSKDDERNGESLSIENQKLILEKYVFEQGWNLIDEYIDDGYSGTTFDRPGVQRLLEDAKCGRINTIIVKDLSRFGRNYIQVGQYTDYIFPMYNIRFIALNDNVDTSKNTTGMDMMPIMNVFNEWHSANTSKKIRAVIEANAKAGKYRTTYAPYGYVKGTDEKKLPVVDEPAASNVRRIFEMRASGISPKHIAQKFNDENIRENSILQIKKEGKETLMLDKDYFNRLVNLRQRLDSVCVGDISTWKDRILLESIIDNKFLEIAEYVFFNFSSWNSIQLDKEFYKLRNYAYSEMDKSCDDNSLIEKYNRILKIERYYGIIEQLDELSVLSEDLYKNLIKKYGYEKISQIDKDNPSDLTKTEKICTDINTYKDDDINKYLVLKRWQDFQNIFASKILEQKLKSDEIEEQVYEQYLKNIHTKTTFRKKYEIMKLLKKDYIDIDLLSKYYAIGMLDEFKQYIGGKAYGLAILNCFRTIPKTIVISHYMEDYNLSTFINKNKTYAIRSSADCEDNVNHSFAGMFNSVLNVSPKEIDVAIKNVKESINENRVQEYIKQFNLNKPHMNIVVQEFIDPDYAGVWLSNSLESGVYELVKGVGEQLVSGSVTPTIHNFDKNDKLSCFFVKLQNEIGSNCDFEFCILNNEIIMLQCRPVTTDIKEDIVINDGIGASYGEVEGEIQFIDNPSKINKFEANKILVTYATDPNWIPAIMKSKGIITSFGGYLCHTSIISRELNKPCVVGINKSLFEKIIKSKRVKMNGFTGEIQILE